MNCPWLSRTLVVAVLGAGAILLGQPAAAVDADLPTTARAFARIHPACDVAGPLADQDVWIFITDKAATDRAATQEGGTDKAGTATVTFTRPGAYAVQVRSIEPGDAVASVHTPAGWTLTAASPGVLLTGTCPAGGSAAGTPTVPANPRNNVVVRALPARTPAPTEEAVARHAAAASLPNTGLDVGGMLILGSALVVAGVLLLIVRRRPDPPHAAAPEPMVWVRTSHDRSGNAGTRARPETPR